MIRTLIAALAAAVITAACSQKEPAPVPRRTAYPRIELYADSTVAAVAGPVSFQINAGADTVQPRPGWLDIRYPRYRAAMHISVRNLDSDSGLREAIANRRQRISLNLGDRRAEESMFKNGLGFNCVIVTSLDGGPTPVQFLAWNPETRTLLSGSAVIGGQAVPADSVAPTVGALTRDALTILNTTDLHWNH